jgi:hypothetical protein
MRRGAPTKYNIEDIVKSLQEYVEQTALPVISRFCTQYGIPREYLYQLAQLSDDLSYSIKIAIAKKEAELEEGGLQGRYAAAMAIFSLKQLGWKDRHDITSNDKTLFKPTDEERAIVEKALSND